jgi:hypothetical protein
MSMKNVVATAIERCAHVPGVPLCEPCIENALRRAYSAGAKMVEDRTRKLLESAEAALEATLPRIPRSFHRWLSDTRPCPCGCGITEGVCRCTDCQLLANVVGTRADIGEYLSILDSPPRR